MKVPVLHCVDRVPIFPLFVVFWVGPSIDRVVLIGRLNDRLTNQAEAEAAAKASKAKLLAKSKAEESIANKKVRCRE